MQMRFKFRQYEITINNIWRILLPFVVGLFSVIYSFNFEGFQFYSLLLLGAVNVLLVLINIKRGFEGYGRKEKRR